MTTKRIRNHELEELSLAALRLELPLKWVIHDYRKDYGIDIQLEIFQANGCATGLRCYGQLKATDNSTDDDVLTLDRDHFEYWSAHTDPVLLLRYYADKREFAWCWLHDVAWSLKADAQSLSVTKFLQPWDKSTSAMAIQDFLDIRSRAFTERLLPPFLVSVRSNTLSLKRLAEVVSCLNAFENLDEFRFETDSADLAVFELSLQSDKFACSHLGFPGLIIEDIDDAAPSVIANGIILLIFLTACRYDRILVARPIVKNSFDLLVTAAGENLFFPLMDSVIYAVGVKEAADLLQKIGLDEVSDFRSALFFGIAFVATQRYGESNQWLSMLRQNLASSQEDTHHAIAAYNLGNALSNKGQWAEALQMFNLAADVFPAYLNRAYFRREYGAALFENEMFVEAVEQYRAALMLEPSSDLHYLLGDALFRAGEFSTAIVEFNVALGSSLSEEAAVMATLLNELCHEFVERWGISNLNHVVLEDGGIDVLQNLLIDESTDPLKLLLPLMQKFGSDALFNFNAGHWALTNGQYELAAYRFLNCAARQRGDSEAWALAIASAMHVQQADLITFATANGYFFVKEKLFEDFFRVAQFANMEEEEKWRRFLLDLAHLSQRRKTSHPLTLRFLGADGNVVTY